MLKPRDLLAATLTTLILTCCSSIASFAGETSVLPITGGAGGIGFDDLGFSRELHKVIIPSGRLGKIVLIDPASKAVEEIGGFSSQSDFAGGHGEGVTSADVGRGSIFATDRDEKTLDLVDPGSKRILAQTKLAAGPDYVRFVAATNEVWVTEPHTSEIEIFSLPQQGFPVPNHAATIAIPGGPESLIIDDAHGRAYTNLWSNASLAIDLHSRAIVARWGNGCHGSRGIALDVGRGFLFVGCEEGKLEVLDSKDGHRLGEAVSGKGVDIIAYAPKLHHAYLPGGDSATMAVVEVSANGKLKILGTVATATDSHCVTADDLGNAYICDPGKGRILLLHDSFGQK